MNTRIAIASRNALAVAAIAFLSACAQSPTAITAAPAMAKPASAAQTYGAAMPADPTPLALSTAMQTVDNFIGKPAKFSGHVGRVCQMKGCWMMLTDGDASVRVKFGNDAFFIPKDSKGDAVVFGTLELITMNAAHAKHMAQDAGETPAEAAKAPTKEYRVMATSVVLAGN